MGICAHVLSCWSKSEKVRVVTYNGKILKFKGQTPVKKITSGPYNKGYDLVHHSHPFSPLPPMTKLEPGEIYYLLPRLLISSKLLYHDHHDDQNKESTCGRQKIKIVVTREQLELLLLRSCSKQLQYCKDVCVGVLSESTFGWFGEEEEGSPKWRPSLASIAEAQEETG